MSNEQAETSSFDQFMKVAMTAEFQQWLEGWRDKVAASKEEWYYHLPERKRMKYPNSMKRTIQDDLNRLMVTDQEILAAAQDSDLDTVAELLPQRRPGDEANFIAKRINDWRKDLAGQPDKDA